MNNLFKTVHFYTLQDDWVMVDPKIISRTANTMAMGKNYSSLKLFNYSKSRNIQQKSNILHNQKPYNPERVKTNEL